MLSTLILHVHTPPELGLGFPGPGSILYAYMRVAPVATQKNTAGL